MKKKEIPFFHKIDAIYQQSLNCPHLMTQNYANTNVIHTVHRDKEND
jgi:hypothetical protein